MMANGFSIRNSPVKTVLAAGDDDPTVSGLIIEQPFEQTHQIFFEFHP